MRLRQLAAFRLQRLEPAHDRGAHLGIEFGERQILKLVAERLHPHAPRQRRIDFHRLGRDALAPAPDPSSAFSVRILCTRSASLTSSTRTSWLIASMNLRKFSACFVSSDCSSSLESFVTPLTRSAISRPNCFSMSACVTSVSSIVSCSKRGHDRRVVELQIGQNAGDFQGMRKIRIAVLALLIAVRLDAEHIGAVQQILVRIGLVGLHLLDKFELPHHGRASPRPPALPFSP